MAQLKFNFFIMCKKQWTIISFFIISIINFANGQTPQSSPSISSFETFGSTPTGLCSGIPDIAHSLLKLPTTSKNIIFDFNIRYHPNNIANHMKATDVGLGWSLFGVGGISKTIVSGADEHYNLDNSFVNYDDVYTYNFFGNYGKFKIVTYNGHYYIEKVTGSILNISFTNTSSNGLFVTALTIVDGNGIKYVFDQTDDVVDRKRIAGTNSFKNAVSNTFFHLTKIYDDLGNLIANIDYETIYSGSFESFKKIKKITAVNMGKLEFDYTANAGFATRNDVGQLNTIRLKNTEGTQIRSCKLGYVFSQHQVSDNVRFLTSLNLCDSNDTPVEKYEFRYAPRSNGPNLLDEYGFTSQYPTNGVLQKVKLPTGGQIAYNFEPNRINNREYQNGEVYFAPVDGLHFEEALFSYQQTDASFSIPNNPSVVYWQEKGGLRIGSILQYDSQGESIPSKSIYYDYSDFNEPNNSSGQMMIEKYLPNEKIQAKVFYKNVKTTEGNGNGHTKYSFLTYTDIERWDGPGGYHSYDHFLIVKDGLLKSKEIYSANNMLLQQDRYYYSVYLEPLIVPDFYFPTDYGVQNFYTYYSVISGTYLASRRYSYNPDKVIVDKSFTLVDPILKKTTNIVTYNSDNQRNITKYYYPAHLPNEPNVSALNSKNRRYDLLKTETFLENDKLLEEKSLYKNWGNGLIAPEAKLSSKNIGTLETREKYTKVDNTNGNLLEIEHENGMKTSYIYGYNNTQKVAKIDNVAYDNIPSNLISAIQTASNAVPYNEQNLLNALEALRSHASMSNAMIETYTYKILVGISSVTDAKGDKISYEYDTFGRLKTIRNKANKIISENEYRYRTQN